MSVVLMMHESSRNALRVLHDTAQLCMYVLQAQVRRINELKMRLTDSERRERQQQLQRTMTLLVHASACDNQNCPSTNCNKVKQLFKHAVACQQKVQGGCHLCRLARLLS